MKIILFIMSQSWYIKKLVSLKLDKCVASTTSDIGKKINVYNVIYYIKTVLETVLKRNHSGLLLQCMICTYETKTLMKTIT